MTLRPFYRSRLFWLGLPGFVFLLWAWLDSGWNTTDLAYCDNTRQRGVAQFQGELIFYRSETPLNRSWPGSYFIHSRTPAAPAGNAWRIGRVSFPKLASHLAEERMLNPQKPSLGNMRQSSVGVALWFVAASYAAAWILTLTWWQRRKSRLLKIHSAP